MDPVQTESPPQLRIEECSCTALRRAARRVTMMYDVHLAPSGLRATQLPVLMVIDELSEAGVNDIARILDLDRTAAGRALRSLEGAGHVIAHRGKIDGRTRVASLTPAGRTALESAKPLWRVAQRSLDAMAGGESGGVRASLARLAPVKDLEEDREPPIPAS